MTRTHHPHTESAQFHPATAEAAFDKLRARIDALPAERVVAPNVDVQAAAIAAIGVATQCAQPDVRKRFEHLAKSGEFDLAAVDELETHAWASWHARHKLLLATAAHSEAQLPAPLVQDALTLRTRMHKLADYHLGDDADLAKRIAAIPTGTGYQDLANSLLAFATLNTEQQAVLSHDRKYYRATDVADARATADKILRGLGGKGTPEEETWTGLQNRAWSLLLDRHEEVRRGGRFLFYYEDGDARFPSLITVVRAAHPTHGGHATAPAETPADAGAAADAAAGTSAKKA